jgi:hypothetical protein
MEAQVKGMRRASKQRQMGRQSALKGFPEGQHSRRRLWRTRPARERYLASVFKKSRANQPGFLFGCVSRSVFRLRVSEWRAERPS